MISLHTDNKAPEHDKLVITTSEVGSRKFPIAREGSIKPLFYIALNNISIFPKIHCIHNTDYSYNDMQNVI